MNETKEISTILFDYGGVLASEGFQDGLQALARRFGIDPQNLAAAGAEGAQPADAKSAEQPPVDPLVSLCQVLLSSNEFLYVE